MRAILVSCVLALGCTNPTAPDAGKSTTSDAAGEGGIADSGWDSGDSGITDDSLPPSSSPELTMRARHLLEAIAQDNPDLAADILFPRDAWINLHDVQDPAKQWDEKVQGAFK